VVSLACHDPDFDLEGEGEGEGKLVNHFKLNKPMYELKGAQRSKASGRSFDEMLFGEEHYIPLALLLDSSTKNACTNKIQ
jgi:hypothetical protein